MKKIVLFTSVYQYCRNYLCVCASLCVEQGPYLYRITGARSSVEARGLEAVRRAQTT